MEGLIMAAQLLLALTILVGLHEFGHFIFARIFNIRVNKFYIFFDFLFPLPNVLNFALWKKKKGDTEYGLGWFPLGGYVDIAGMIDETKDASQLSSTPEPWEFRSKPAWQRLFVMLGGIIVNVILGILIFSGVKYVWGDEDYTKEEINKRGIFAYPMAEKIGLKTGDKITKINGKDYETLSELRGSITNENVLFTVERDSTTLEIPIPNELIDKVAQKNYFIDPIIPFEVDRVTKGMPAEKSGLRSGDKIVSFNGTPITYYQQIQPLIKKSANKKVDLGIERKGTSLVIHPVVTADSAIGFYPKSLLTSTKAMYSLPEAFKVGSVEALGVIPQQINGFARIFKGHISPKNALTGPVGLAQMFSPKWDWEKFWALTGLLSMALAFMNALPIPALDGGHVIVLLYEMISGRKPSEKFMERTQQIGTFILLALMVYVLFNDTLKLLF
ncbi:RIP metalloprotease RseP [Lacihabitans soyangensis]|uniref:Zinc metalloprotease n=1 Tax=Lacihabitans soyangensis TaxID=869394 RepID=A0AAE3KU97_9BACT|nr:RIP metalloprotease RseP [Lacihabitans soyangensis]MCP9764843.1 RIP metalloprotease RseP [Lacihabitans soyangensis]